MVGRRVMALALAALPAGCAGVSPIEAARLARDGEHATGRLAADVSAAQQRVERARDLVLLRAALAAGDPAALSAAGAPASASCCRSW